MPWAEIPDGVARPKRTALHQLPGKRARTCDGEGIAEGRGLHRLPWRARDSCGERCEVADLQVHCSGDKADRVKMVLIALDAGAIDFHLNNVGIDAVDGGAESFV